jgi:hypothetical protein
MKTEFSDSQFKQAYPDGIENHWWQLTRNKLVVDTLSSISTINLSVLEVGCGRGITVMYLRDNGFECCGVDLGKVRPLSSVERYINSGVSAVDLPSNERQKYDTILLLDVIEHLPDPVLFLKTIEDAFVNLKNVIITVPARQELWSNYDEFYGHYRRYSDNMLYDLARSLGWELSYVSYFFHGVYLPAWILSKLKKKRKTRFTAPQKTVNWFHKLLSVIMISEYKILPKTIFGSSLIVKYCLNRNVN